MPLASEQNRTEESGTGKTVSDMLGARTITKPEIRFQTSDGKSAGIAL